MKLTKFALMLALAGAPAVFAEESPTKMDQKREAKALAEAKPGTLASIIADGVTFSILEKAIDAAGLQENLSGNAPLTVFAPTDEAFEKLPEGALEKLMLPENQEKLRTLILYHVVNGQFLSSDLRDAEIKSASGDKIEVDVDGTTVKVEDSKVVKADEVASNGVVHVIDKVMVPKSLDGFADLDED